MTTALTTLLGIRLPVIQAPMAGVQDHRLAAAVSAAGGLGSLPAAMLSPAVLAAELAALRAATATHGLPFNVNFFCHVPREHDAAREAAWRAVLRPYGEAFGIDIGAAPAGAGRAPFSAQIADIVEPFAPPVVSFHFGLPDAALVDRVKRWGAKVLATATTVEEGLWLQERGVDAVIAQGLEAGGHQGHFLRGDLDVGTSLGLFALLPQLVAALRVPAIAAGGIADAAGVAAAQALGAAGVQAGTAYLLSDEAMTTALHRAALQSPAAATTALTNLYTGRPARGIVNRLMRELGPINRQAPTFPHATAGIAPLRAAAEAAGSGDFSPLWAGQHASRCRAAPAAEITRALAAGWAASEDAAESGR